MNKNIVLYSNLKMAVYYTNVSLSQESNKKQFLKIIYRTSILI